MNTETVAKCMKTSFANTPFPVVVQKLAGGGVSAYNADLITLRKTYYDAGSASFDGPMPLTDSPPTAATFDRNKVAATVKAIQRKGSRRVPAADHESRLPSYRACFGGRKAMYFGRDGEFYTEPFPSK